MSKFVKHEEPRISTALHRCNTVDWHTKENTSTYPSSQKQRYGEVHRSICICGSSDPRRRSAPHVVTCSLLVGTTLYTGAMGIGQVL